MVPSTTIIEPEVFLAKVNKSPYVQLCNSRPHDAYIITRNTRTMTTLDISNKKSSRILLSKEHDIKAPNAIIKAFRWWNSYLCLGSTLTCPFKPFLGSDSLTTIFSHQIFKYMYSMKLTEFSWIKHIDIFTRCRYPMLLHWKSYSCKETMNLYIYIGQS